MKKRNRGFTLIELLVTIALMSIFSVFALRLFTNGFILHNDYRARSLEFFEDTVKKSKAEKLLKEHPIRCDQKGIWTFNSENSDSLMNLFPYKASRCAHKAGGWIVIYAEVSRPLSFLKNISSQASSLVPIFFKKAGFSLTKVGKVTDSVQHSH